MKCSRVASMIATIYYTSLGGLPTTTVVFKIIMYLKYSG